MIDILIYVPLSNEHRLPIMEQVARQEIARGNRVSIYVEIITPLCDSGNNISINFFSIAKHLNLSVFDEVYVDAPSLIRGVQLIKGGESARLAHRELRKMSFQCVLEDKRYKEVYLWNGNFPYQTDFIALAKKKGIQLNYIEVAWFDQSDTYYVDSNGVNANSRIAKLAEKAGSEFNRAGELFSQEYLQKIPEKCRKEGGYILVPMQVESDSNIRLYSPYNSMASFVQALSKWLPSGVNVKVRRHPKSSMKEFPLPPGFCWSGESHLFKDISEAALVVGINSTVLLQAIALGKPTIAFGRGIWGTHPAIVQGDTEVAFQWPTFNKSNANNLVGYLLSHQRYYPPEIFSGNGYRQRFWTAMKLVGVVLRESAKSFVSISNLSNIRHR